MAIKNVVAENDPSLLVRMHAIVLQGARVGVFKSSRFEIAGPEIGGVTLIVFRWDTYRASSKCEGEVRSL